MSDREDQGEAITRREVLSQQFDAAEEAVEHGESEEFPQSREPTERARGDDGKFVSRETSEKPEKVSAAQENTAEKPEGENEPPVWARPPASWRKEYHEAWKALDPKGQQYIHQREEQMRAGVELAIPKARLADEITKVAEPYMNTIRGLGVDLPRAVKGLLEVDNTLRNGSPEQKRTEFMRLAQTYGINLGAQSQQGQQQPVNQDPNYYALTNQLNNLRGEVLSFKQAQEQAQQASYLNEINRFAQTKPHFTLLRPHMVTILEEAAQKNEPMDLESAYTKALENFDELSVVDRQAQQAVGDKAQRETANRAAKSARAAAVSVKTSTPGRQASTNAQDRRSMLREQFDGLSERL